MGKNYEIPDSYDPIWQSQMLRELEENLRLLRERFNREILDDALAITIALRNYSD